MVIFSDILIILMAAKIRNKNNVRYILGAIALMLIFESLFPLIAPQKWRETLRKILFMEDKLIRKVAFVIFLIGCFLWIIVQHTDFLIES